MADRRKVVTRSPYRTVGRINRCSHFQKEPIEYESQLEKQFVYLAMLCPSIVQIKHQPFTLTLTGSEFKKYTPDFLLTLKDGSHAVIEIKPKKNVKKNTERFKVISAALAVNQLPFFVITDEDLSEKKRSKHAERILRYLNWKLEPNVIPEVIGALNEAAAIPISEILDVTQASSEDLMHMVSRRMIFSTDLAMTVDASLQLNNLGANHGIFHFTEWFNTQVWRSDV